MKVKTFIILFLVCTTLFGQKRKTKTSRFSITLIDPTIDISYGYRLVSSNFYNQLNTFKDFDYHKPLSYVGLGISDHWNNIRGTASYQVYFHRIIPQQIKLNDTINCNIQGFISSVAFNQNLLKSKFFGIYIGLGINAGRLKLYEKDIINKTCYILTPKVALTPSIFINRVYLQFSFEYDYDFLNSDWTNHGDNSTKVFKPNKLSQTSLMAYSRLGFFLRKQK